MLFANAFAAENRVEVKGLNFNDHTLKAKDIPISDFLPSSEDEQLLHKRMICIESRILVNHVPFCQTFKDAATWHVPHEYSAEMSEQQCCKSSSVLAANISWPILSVMHRNVLLHLKVLCVLQFSVLNIYLSVYRDIMHLYRSVFLSCKKTHPP